MARTWSPRLNVQASRICAGVASDGRQSGESRHCPDTTGLPGCPGQREERDERDAPLVAVTQMASFTRPKPTPYRFWTATTGAIPSACARCSARTFEMPGAGSCPSPAVRPAPRSARRSSRGRLAQIDHVEGRRAQRLQVPLDQPAGLDPAGPARLSLGPTFVAITSSSPYGASARRITSLAQPGSRTTRLARLRSSSGRTRRCRGGSRRARPPGAAADDLVLQVRPGACRCPRAASSRIRFAGRRCPRAARIPPT